MFEDSTQREGTRRRGRWPLAASALLHLAAVAALALGAGRGPAAARPGERQIDVVFLREALAGDVPAAPRPASPAEWRAERERQAMLDRLVQPTAVPDAAAPDAGTRREDGASAATADPAVAGPAAAQPDLPVAAGGRVTPPEVVESSRVMPDYPEAAQRSGLEGQVVLRALIDRQGRAREIRVLRGLGLGLDEAAVAAVRKWRFRPATRNGAAVEVFYVLSLYFRLEAPGSAPESPPARPRAQSRDSPPAPN